MKILGKIGLAIFSVLITALVFEIGMQIVLDPLDLLWSQTTPDPVLRYRIVPGSGGHDDWGFRNKEIPESVDVVTLGDSMTYGGGGVTVPVRKNWPSRYGELRGHSVYNLGIWGYGPAHYLHLLETRGLGLQPKKVIVALYLGNDFHDSYTSVRDFSRWESLRTNSMGPFEPGAYIWEGNSSSHPVARVRDFLRSQSMVWNSLEAGPIGEMVNAFGDQRDEFSGHGCTVKTDEPFSSLIQAEGDFFALDPDSVIVQEGFVLTGEIFRRISELTREQGIELTVVLIPTKETVLVGPQKEVKTECEEIVQELIAAESVYREKMTQLLRGWGVHVVDPLERMREESKHVRLYMRSADCHPVARGYELIAEAIAESELPPVSLEVQREWE